MPTDAQICFTDGTPAASDRAGHLPQIPLAHNRITVRVCPLLRPPRLGSVFDDGDEDIAAVAEAVCSHWSPLITAAATTTATAAATEMESRWGVGQAQFLWLRPSLYTIVMEAHRHTHEGR